MKIHHLCNYYPQNAHNNGQKRTDEQWHAYKFCGAVKDKSLKGWLLFPRKTKPPIKIETTSVAACRLIFGQFLQYVAKKHGLEVVFVPVPSKDALVAATSSRSSEMLMEAITLAKVQLKMLAPIRFTEVITPAHQGGPRGRALMRGKMRLVGPVPKGTRVILVDDLYTSGGNFLASYDVLRAAGVDVVAGAVCGYTNNDPTAKPWGPHEMLVDPTLP